MAGGGVGGPRGGAAEGAAEARVGAMGGELRTGGRGKQAGSPEWGWATEQAERLLEGRFACSDSEEKEDGAAPVALEDLGRATLKGGGGVASGSESGGSTRSQARALAAPSPSGTSSSVIEQQAELIVLEEDPSSSDDSKVSVGVSAGSLPRKRVSGEDCAEVESKCPGRPVTGAEAGSGDGDSDGNNDSDSGGSVSSWPTPFRSARKSGRPRVEALPSVVPDPTDESDSEEDEEEEVRGRAGGGGGGGHSLESPFVYQRHLAQGREVLSPATPRRTSGGTALLGSSSEYSSSEEDDWYSNWPSAFRTPKEPPARPPALGTGEDSPLAGRGLDGERAAVGPDGMLPAASDMSRDVISALESMEKSRSCSGRSPSQVAKADLTGEVAVSPGGFQALKDEFESVREASPHKGGEKALLAPEAHLNPELLFGGGSLQHGRATPVPRMPNPNVGLAGGATPLESLGAMPGSAFRRAMSTPSSQEAVDRLEEQEAHLVNVQADLGQLLHTTSKLRDALHGSTPGREPSLSGSARPTSWVGAELGLQELQRALASLDTLEEKVAFLLREKAINSGHIDAAARNDGFVQQFEALAAQVQRLQSEVSAPGEGGDAPPLDGGAVASMREQVTALHGGLSSMGRDLEALKEGLASREAGLLASNAEIDQRLAATTGDVEALSESVDGVCDNLESIEARLGAVRESSEAAQARIEDMQAEMMVFRGAQTLRGPPGGESLEELEEGQETAAPDTAEDAAAGVAEALQSFEDLWQKIEHQCKDIEFERAGTSAQAKALLEDLQSRMDHHEAVTLALNKVVGELQDSYDTLALSVLELRAYSSAQAPTGAIPEGDQVGPGELVGGFTEIQAKMAMLEAEVAGIAEDLEKRLAKSDTVHRESAAALAGEVEALKQARPSAPVRPEDSLEGLGSSATGLELQGDVVSMLVKLHVLEKCVVDIDQEVKSLSWIAEGEDSAPSITAPAVEPPASPSLDKMEELLPGILRRELGSFAETLVHLESTVARLDLELKEAKRSAESRGNALDVKLRGLQVAAAEATADPAPSREGPAVVEALERLEDTVSRLDSDLREARRVMESRDEALKGKICYLEAAVTPQDPAVPLSAPPSPAPPASPATSGAPDAGGLEETVACLVQRPLGGLLRKIRELEARMYEIGKENRDLGGKASRVEEAMRGLEKRLAERLTPAGGLGSASKAREGAKLSPSAAGPLPAAAARPVQTPQKSLSVTSVVLIFAVLNCSVLWLSALFSQHGLGGALDFARVAPLPQPT